MKGMNTFDDMLPVAAGFHEMLPDRIREYLNGRGIPDATINRYLLGWDDRRITIPITNREGIVSFFKLAKDPADTSDTPKMLTMVGASMDLYGWERVIGRKSPIVICEGEFDRLVLEARGFAAVTSTGGAGVFRREWAKEFADIAEVYVCFDNDDAGQQGAVRVGQMIPHARLISLPEDVGPGGDVTDFFVRLGKGNGDFISLMEAAQPAPQPPVVPPRERPPLREQPDSMLAQRITRLKAAVAIAEVVGQYVDLRLVNGLFRGICPFHADENPSFVVYPTTGTFHCFGCRLHGDVIKFLMTIAKLTFTQALAALEHLTHRNDKAA